MEVIGDGEVDEIVVEAENANALLFRATMGRVANLSLRQMEGGQWHAVVIRRCCSYLRNHHPAGGAML